MGIRSIKARRETRRAFSFLRFRHQRRRLLPQQGAEHPRISWRPTSLPRVRATFGGGLHHAVVLATRGAGATEQDAIEGIEQTAALVGWLLAALSPAGATLPH